jgi:hypothetical protein
VVAGQAVGSSGREFGTLRQRQARNGRPTRALRGQGTHELRSATTTAACNPRIQRRRASTRRRRWIDSHRSEALLARARVGHSLRVKCDEGSIGPAPASVPLARSARRSAMSPLAASCERRTSSFASAFTRGRKSSSGHHDPGARGGHGTRRRGQRRRADRSLRFDQLARCSGRLRRHHDATEGLAAFDIRVHGRSLGERERPGDLDAHRAASDLLEQIGDHRVDAGVLGQ